MSGFSRPEYFSALKQWVSESGRKPLILRGARQVGKSTLVRLFAENEGLDLIEINLEKQSFASLKKDRFTMEDWLLEIESYCGKKIGPKSLIFFDEIQAQPIAISRLRYFFEERPEIAVIAAGSLLELVLNQEEISFPVGRVSFLWVSPMTFFEFLEAQNLSLLKEAIGKNKILESTHELLNTELKKFFYIGGMPRAVKTFVETGSMIKVREVQSDILEAYASDFPKYQKKRAVFQNIQRIFQVIPKHLGKKLIFQHVDQDLKSGEIKTIVELLIKANILMPCYHTAPQIPLRANVDFGIYKVYFIDIGLVNCIHSISWNDLNALFDNSFSTKGFLAEQFVAQHLAFHQNLRVPPSLHFWLRDRASQKAEIDFLISHNQNVIPIEVKAEKGGRLKSLEVFCKENEIRNAIKISKEIAGEEKISSQGKEICKIKKVPFYALEKMIQDHLG